MCHRNMACCDAQARATLEPCSSVHVAAWCNLVFDRRCVQTRVERATERVACWIIDVVHSYRPLADPKSQHSCNKLTLSWDTVSSRQRAMLGSLGEYVAPP
jgi:hypothetical protein